MKTIILFFILLFSTTSYADTITIDAKSGNLNGFLIDAEGYIYSPTNNLGDVTFNININTPGEYVLWGLVLKDITGGQNSFYVSINSQAKLMWGTPTDTVIGWVWDKMTSDANPITFSLITGMNTIVISSRESNTKLQKLIITNDTSFNPNSISIPIKCVICKNMQLVKIGWDTVLNPKDENNNIIPGTVKYQVYTRNDLISTGVAYGSEITDTQISISFLPNVIYYIGVESIFYPTDTNKPILKSTKSWSDNSSVCYNNEPFGFLYEPFIPTIDKPTGIRILTLLKQWKNKNG